MCTTGTAISSAPLTTPAEAEKGANADAEARVEDVRPVQPIVVVGSVVMATWGDREWDETSLREDIGWRWAWLVVGIRADGARVRRMGVG